MVGSRAWPRFTRTLLAAAAEDRVRLALRRVGLRPRRALVRFKVWRDLTWEMLSPFGRFVILGSGVSRAHWMESADGVVWMLIGANVTVFMMWRVADPDFMRRHFMASEMIN